MKTLFAIAAFFCSMAAPAQMICRDNILQDGGFETPVLSGGSSAYVYNPTGTPWVFEGGSGIQRNGSAWGAEDAPEGV